MEPVVSICIPCYNGKPYLSEVLHCVEAQTCSNFEVLISDDGSTDGTLNLIQDFAESSRHHVRIMAHKQLGLVNNWNFCVKEAKGKYIKFLFQDDLLERDCIEKLMQVAERDDEIGLVFSKRRILLGDGTEEPDEAWKKKNWFLYDLHGRWSGLNVIQSGMDLLSDPKLLEEPLNKIGEPTTVLLRKSALEDVGFFDESLRQAVDSEMWFRILTKYKCGFVDRYLSTYRVHDKQASQENVDAGIIQDDYCAVMAKIATHPSFARIPESQRCSAWIKAWQMNPRNTGVSSVYIWRMLWGRILSNPVSRSLLVSEIMKSISHKLSMMIPRRVISDLKWWVLNWPKRLFSTTR